MAQEDTHPQLQMVWPERLLDSPPQVRMPQGYRLRTYRPGDEGRYFEMMALAGWPNFDEVKLRPWLYRMLPEGWYMAVQEDDDLIVASAMATHDPTWIVPFAAELGYVAADPAHAGKGLGQAVVAAATARFLSAGYAKIHLFTEHYRLPALKIYLRLGYVPFLQPPEAIDTWKLVFENLGLELKSDMI